MLFLKERRPGLNNKRETLPYVFPVCLCELVDETLKEIYENTKQREYSTGRTNV